jgi:hypothetical protein
MKSAACCRRGKYLETRAPGVAFERQSSEVFDPKHLLEREFGRRPNQNPYPNMPLRFAIVVLPLLLFGLVSCSSSSGATDAVGKENFPATPVTASPIPSDGGKLSVTVWTSPDQPPTRGIIAVKLLIRDASSGSPLDGLTLVVVPEMTSMGHGASVVPTVTPSGDGVYVVSNLDLFMPGAWTLLTTITGPVTDTMSIPIDVQ